MLRLTIYVPLFLLIVVGKAVAQPEPLSPVLKTQSQAQQQQAQSQKRIDQMDDITKKALEEYRATRQSLQELQTYNQQLSRQIQDQKTEMAQLEQERLEIETTRRQFVPFMLRMQEVLEEFIRLDTPFLPQERQQRLVQLQDLMQRADVPLAEKFRRMLEAYRVEAEYGHNLESYQGELKLDVTRTVNFLRVGRVGLYYLTLDGKEAGVWDNRQQDWMLLDNEYLEAIKQGLLMARRQLPPNLVVLPVKSAEVAK